MQSGKKIRVIKRDERRQAQTTLSQNGEVLSGEKDESGQGAVKVVTGWIGELRRKKVAEAAHGFESLFGKAA